MRRLTRLPRRVLDALAQHFADSGTSPRGGVYTGDIASSPPPREPPPDQPAVLSEMESRPIVERDKQRKKRIAKALLQVTRPNGPPKGE